MATVAFGSCQTIDAWPFLIKKYTVTGGTTGAALTHGEDREPDMIQITKTMADPTASEFSVVRTNATSVTVDCEANSATKTAELYLIWLSQASGGIS